jgi:hypothetical protein
MAGHRDEPPNTSPSGVLLTGLYGGASRNEIVKIDP